MSLLWPLHGLWQSTPILTLRYGLLVEFRNTDFVKVLPTSNVEFELLQCQLLEPNIVVISVIIGFCKKSSHFAVEMGVHEFIVC
jgi:hypothetical protein